MDEAGFTKGPWKQRNPLSATILAHRVHNRADGSSMEWDGPVAKAEPWTSEDERLANARLIAAAPALYEALESLLTCVEYVDALPGSKGHTVREQAFAAISLARSGRDE